MALAGFLFLLLLTAVNGDSSGNSCSYQHVLDHLNLTKNSELFSMTRPVKNHSQPTEVRVEVFLKAILDVRETDQTFVSDVLIYLNWDNEYIGWDPDIFCGIEGVTVPAEALWKPDIIIEEAREMTSSSPAYLSIESTGVVTSVKKQMLVSTCRMAVFKFPFDNQECTLSFRSAIHAVSDIKLLNLWESSLITEWSRDLIQNQYEWFFIDMTVTTKTVNVFFKQDVIIYTITMRRRSALYIVNFLLPVLFFLCLDLASFFIAESSGEKLGYKVTVLLAVTVMQLILNEILPFSSNRIPLIAIYCVGIFALMMLSLLETILVMYLVTKDSQENETDRNRSLSVDYGNKQGGGGCVLPEEKTWPRFGSSNGTSTELLKGSSSQLSEEEKLSDELKKVIQLLTSSKEEGKPGYWAEKTKTINRVYFIFYVSAVSAFLVCMCFTWYYA